MEVAYNGITDTLTGWSRRTGIAVNTLYGRVGMGWEPERIFGTQPIKRTYVNLEQGIKTCYDCNAELPLSEFYPRRSLGPNYYFSRCKTCEARRIKGVRQGEREQIIESYSNGANRCGQCGEERIAVLDLDHISGGGSYQRRTEGISSQGLYRRLIREGFPPGYQILCRNCNWFKHLEGGK